MKTLTVKKLLIPAALITLVVGCAEMQQPQSLLDAQQAYKVAASNPTIQKYATDELTKANETLLSAVAAESVEDMSSLAYIGNAQVQTAVNIAAAKQSTQTGIDLMQKKEQLITDSLSLKKETAQQQLLTMQLSEAERDILLAFGKIEFVTGTANLIPGAASGIDMLAAYMAQNSSKNVMLSGHTDNTGSTQLNKDLSQQRASFIRNVLISKGVAADRITAIGYGESQPVASNSSEAGRQKNRRIDISFN